MQNRYLGEPIPRFERYTITFWGEVYNWRREKITPTFYKGRQYVRIYRKGQRYTLSINKLLYQIYQDEGVEDTIELEEGELIFRYENTQYYITSNCRVYNRKNRKWVNVIYRNGYPTVNLTFDGQRKALSLLKFLKSKGGVCNG
jgi:hypothetical protein